MYDLSYTLSPCLLLEGRALLAGGAEDLHGGQVEAFDAEQDAGAGEGGVPGDLKVGAEEAVG
jgi:hypothetical protein